MKCHKLLLVLLGFCVALGAAAPVQAQTDSCVSRYWYYFPDPHGIPADAYDCQYDAPTISVCKIEGSCVPAVSGSESGSGRGGCLKEGRPTGGGPICLATGNTYIEQQDVRIPGLGGGLTLLRTWNSKWPASQTSTQTGIFGANWRSTYEERIFLDTNDHYIRYARSDGSYAAFAYSGANTSPDNTFNYTPVAPANLVATLKTGSTWTLTFQDGEQRVFDQINGPNTGKLLAIIDRNGNATQLTYDEANRLTTVTGPAGRHLYFTYGAGDQSYLVTKVSSDAAAGISVTYTYDTQTPPRLARVTRADNTYISFEYDSHSLISAVKDMQGKILESHTYDDFGRGLSSSRAGGVEAITVTYPVQQ